MFLQALGSFVFFCVFAHLTQLSTVQLPPEIEYKDSGYVARVVVFALMCLGCFLSALLWIGEVSAAAVRRGL
jgi:hypothetical protein